MNDGKDSEVFVRCCSFYLKHFLLEDGEVILGLRKLRKLRELRKPSRLSRLLCEVL